MDAVYLLGHGSLAHDEELRYSVRSLAQNMLDLGRVFVVGKKPDCLPGAVHIPAEDTHRQPWRNVHSKTLLACSTAEISDDFLLMNDDFFLLTPFNGAEWPYFALKGGDGGASGRESFSVHCPMPIKKEWYAAVPLAVDAKGDYSPRSFYANFIRAPFKSSEDCIVRTGKGLRSFAEQIRKQDFFSISDMDMLDPDFRSWLDALYPEPSAFE